MGFVLSFRHIVDLWRGAFDGQIKRVRGHFDSGELRQDHVLQSGFLPDLGAPQFRHPFITVAHLGTVRQFIRFQGAQARLLHFVRHCLCIARADAAKFLAGAHEQIAMQHVLSTQRVKFTAHAQAWGGISHISNRQLFAGMFGHHKAISLC